LEGIVDPGDMINPGKRCLGTVSSISENGRGVVINTTFSCNALPGDVFFLTPDVSVVESFSGRQFSKSQRATVSVSSDYPVKSDHGVYKRMDRSTLLTKVMWS
jgi:hypothetical protein